MNLCDDHSWAGEVECPHCESAWRGFAGTTAPATPLESLIELAATWCEAAARGGIGTPELWQNRAKMLRDRYQPKVVRSATKCSTSDKLRAVAAELEAIYPVSARDLRDLADALQ